MNTIMMWIMAAGAVLGGTDRILGNRLGFGKRFEEGFMLLGATALSMTGIICLAPVLADFLERVAAPLWLAAGLDPATLGGILAIDMGGYQLAGELARKSAMASYAGLVIGATFGCTITFTIPVGMGMLEQEDRPLFARGILTGLGVMPLALLVGGLFCGLRVSTVLLQSLPIFLLSFLLMAGIGRFQEKMIRGFGWFAGAIRILTTIGLIAGAVRYMTGVSLAGDLAPIEEAMGVVSSIGIVMLGSLPVAELLKRMLGRPLRWAGKVTGMNETSIAGLLIGIVSPVPAMAMMRDMDDRGKIVNAAFLVCGASALAAHMGFTFGTEPDMVVPLLVSKLIGGAAAAIAALIVTKKPVAVSGRR
ncbi:ethanolamine utilization protein EutH [Parablautia sp. Marseille-Q6255]|uniref:ethanolamine utilization protein EutH n=1 Tax=Parablautia sp. Marseille-Q6255 TaxID=3039593 RepID=UPI0024BD518E|nr:ethanolamine utilization protein EutH [Parablautia sp. Marseille-Q6255]